MVDDQTRYPVEVGDILIPSGTLLTFTNLPFFAVYRAYTAAELHRLTRGPKRDPGWNMPVVEKAIKWAEEETSIITGMPRVEGWVLTRSQSW